jgi:hypothetical protein
VKPERLLALSVVLIVGLYVLGRLEPRRRGIVTIEDL